MCMSQQLVFDLAQSLHWMPFPVQLLPFIWAWDWHTDLWGVDCVPLKWKTRSLSTMCLSKQPKTAASLSAWQAPIFVNWTQTHPWKWLKLKIPVCHYHASFLRQLFWKLFPRTRMNTVYLTGEVFLRSIMLKAYLYSLWTHLHAALLHKTMWKIILKFKQNRYKIATRSYS